MNMNKVAAAIFVALGVAIIGVSIFNNAGMRKKTKKYVETTAVIVDFQYETHTTQGKASSAYYPIYAYSYNGVEYTNVGSVSYTGMEKKSAEVKFYVNPEHPKEGFSETDHKGFK